MKTPVKKTPKQKVKEAVAQLRALKESKIPPKITFVDFLINESHK